MSKVAIVTDSTAYLPADVSKGYEVHSVPLQIIWGSDIYRDGVDITPDQFYERLPGSKINATTSQPSPAAFREVYSRLTQQGFDILSVHISTKLSGTIDSAAQAKANLSNANIEIVDSFTTSMSMGFQVMTAARAAAQGRLFAAAAGRLASWAWAEWQGTEEKFARVAPVAPAALLRPARRRLSTPWE